MAINEEGFLGDSIADFERSIESQMLNSLNYIAGQIRLLMR